MHSVDNLPSLYSKLKTSQYLVWPQFASRSATHLLRIELIRLLIVECWSTPLQWLCEVAGYWQELEQAVVYADPEYPKHAQWGTCSVSMLAMQKLWCFQLPGIVHRSLQHGVVHYHAATWGDGRGWMDLRISSWYLINKMHLCSLSTTYPCPYHNPTRSTMLTSANCSPTRRHTHCLPSALYSENRDSSVKRTPLQSARHHRMWAFAHSSWLRRWTAVRLRSPWGRRACRWASLRRFLTVCAEILWLCKLIVAAAVRWLISDDLGGEDAGCGGPGLVKLLVVCGCEAGCMYCQILWNAFGDGLW